MTALLAARLLIGVLPFKWWRHTLGGRVGAAAAPARLSDAERLAAHVEWAARLLPIRTTCLPRAMALSWMLARRGLSHTLVFAVRPAGSRGSDADLHAWVEIGGSKLIGALPGPWVETLRLG